MLPILSFLIIRISVTSKLTFSSQKYFFFSGRCERLNSLQTSEEGREVSSGWWRTEFTNSEIRALVYKTWPEICNPMHSISKWKHAGYVSDMQISAGSKKTLFHWVLLQSQSNEEVPPQKGQWGEQHSILIVFQKGQPNTETVQL